MTQLNSTENEELPVFDDYIKITITAQEPITQGLDLIFAVCKFMRNRMTTSEYSDFLTCISAIFSDKPLEFE